MRAKLQAGSSSSDGSSSSSSEEEDDEDEEMEEQQAAQQRQRPASTSGRAADGNSKPGARVLPCVAGAELKCWTSAPACAPAG
jgi:hypothetical protein